MPIAYCVALAAAAAGCSSDSTPRDAGSGNDAATDVASNDGGNDGGNDAVGTAVIDCDWLTGDNCWKTTGSQAIACLPPPAETGTLSADNTSCTYASGIRVTFAAPIVLPVPDGPTWNFTVTGANGEACLHFEQSTAQGMKLVVAGQTAQETIVGGVDLTVTCPDGVRYRAPNALDLVVCPTGLNGLPGLSWVSSDTSLSVALQGVSADSLQAFDCRKP